MADAHDPDHYKVGGIESIDVIRAKLTPEEFRGFCLGNAMKYVHRAGHKGSAADDAKKAQVYLGWLSEAEQKSESQQPPCDWTIVGFAKTITKCRELGIHLEQVTVGADAWSSLEKDARRLDARLCHEHNTPASMMLYGVQVKPHSEQREKNDQ